MERICGRIRSITRGESEGIFTFLDAYLLRYPIDLFEASGHRYDKRLQWGFGRGHRPCGDEAAKYIFCNDGGHGEGMQFGPNGCLMHDARRFADEEVINVEEGEVVDSGENTRKLRKGYVVYKRRLAFQNKLLYRGEIFTKLGFRRRLGKIVSNEVVKRQCMQHRG